MSWLKNYVLRVCCWIIPGVLLYFGNKGLLLSAIGGVLGVLGVLANFVCTFSEVPIKVKELEIYLFQNYLTIVVNNILFTYKRSESEFYDFMRYSDPKDFILLQCKNTLGATLNNKLALRRER